MVEILRRYAAQNDIQGDWSDYETMMTEKFGKDLTPYRVKYRTLKR